MKTYSTGELARTANVSVETVRYYERRGLLPKPSSRPSGYREYTIADVDRLEFIRSAQSLGFTLNEISRLLSLLDTPATSCNQLREEAILKIHEIEEKISELKLMKKRLQQMVDGECDAGRLHECNLLPIHPAPVNVLTRETEA